MRFSDVPIVGSVWNALEGSGMQAWFLGYPPTSHGATNTRVDALDEESLLHLLVVHDSATKSQVLYFSGEIPQRQRALFEALNFLIGHRHNAVSGVRSEYIVHNFSIGCDGSLMPIAVNPRQYQPRLACSKGLTGYEFAKEPDSGTFVDA